MKTLQTCPRMLWLLLLALAGGSVFAQSQDNAAPLLLRNPSLSKAQIAFSYAGDLWTVDRNGGEARRLTSGAGVNRGPIFSPDGRMIAFTGEYDGNQDVYVIPAEGGAPTRLTYHPGADVAVGWTPDGKQILFRSGRNSSNRYVKLFSVGLAKGGFPFELPLPTAVDGSYSGDGSRIAYSPIQRWEPGWKQYRGGQTTPIWIADLKTLAVEKVPRDNSNDENPMFVGNSVYFLSDRDGAVALYHYDLGDKKVEQVVANNGMDIKSAAAGPGGIVYDQFGELHLYDFAAKQQHVVPVSIHSDLPNTRSRMARVSPKRIENFGLSPSGARAVFEARGEIFTVPAEKGDVRNLTNTPNAAERDPAWSPDGKSIAYFGDSGGEYQLYIAPQEGLGAKRAIRLSAAPSFFYQPVWSPDSKKIAFSDKHLTLWYLDVSSANPTPIKIVSDTYDAPERTLDPSWSPDGKWIAYTKQLKSHFHAVFLYSLEKAQSHQITDGLSDTLHAVWDKDGKYLYFTASTDVGPSAGWLDLSSYGHTQSRNIYLAVLSKDTASPLTPESDDEKGAEAAKDKDKDKGKGKDDKEKDKATEALGQKDKADENKPEVADAKAAEEAAKKPVTVKMDLEGIGQRILALPLPAKNYTAIAAGKQNELIVAEAPASPGEDEGPGAGITLQKFDLKTRKADKLLDGVKDFTVSANGEKVLYSMAPGKWFVASTSAAKQGEGGLKLEGMQAYIDPRAEWAQMYHETWRIERDFLYDPNAHGYDMKAAEKEYAKYLPGLGSRDDLNYLFVEMLSGLSLGHVFVRGGGEPDAPERVHGGLLGADYRVANGRYQFSNIYNGENWNPELHAPLTQPGVNVKAGEYLLAVNGRELRASENLFSFFEGTAARSVVLKVGPNPDGSGAREVAVVPVPSETGLRNLAWIESNRRQVDKMSGGRLAYVYLPDTANGGYTAFNRYYFAQVGKEGAVIDERYNGGGELADYIVDYLKRPVMSFVAARDGETQAEPVGAIFGPKVMIINESAGSGGDAMPWYFRRAGVGKLVGTRTWGGLVGIYSYPTLMDGGSVTAPRAGIYGLKGEWEVENHGISPDIAVEMDPKSVSAGHDPQLERAVEEVMAELKANPLPTYKRPAFPNFHETARRLKAGAGHSK
ncbi:MAG: PDZ domain-containing protein [Acidobacteriaceae bacterium]